jgi:2-amino-4-hydroxy-6-hydroxymethyldihydropteridine diphosphokinase
MILIGAGANRPGIWGTPEQTIARALTVLAASGVEPRAVSPAYLSAPVGPGPQDPYVNLVARVETHLPPLALLDVLQRIERAAGRRAAPRWSARELDLDLLAYHRLVAEWPRLVLPHPRLRERPFVLRPLADLCPGWHHPVSGETARQLWQRLRTRRAGRILAPLAPVPLR